MEKPWNCIFEFLWKPCKWDLFYFNPTVGTVSSAKQGSRKAGMISHLSDCGVF